MTHAPVEVQQAEEKPKQPQLPWALGIAAGIAIVMTIMSVAIYYFAGFYKLDLSRPGYEAERQDIVSDVEQSFDTTSPLTQAALDKELGELDKRIENLKAFGDFRDNALSDSEILLSN